MPFIEEAYNKTAPQILRLKVWALITDTDVTHTQPCQPSRKTISRSLAGAGNEGCVNRLLLLSRLSNATTKLAPFVEIHRLGPVMLTAVTKRRWDETSHRQV